MIFLAGLLIGTTCIGFPLGFLAYAVVNVGKRSDDEERAIITMVRDIEAQARLVRT